jgi:hypothetical protein
MQIANEEDDALDDVNLEKIDNYKSPRDDTCALTLKCVLSFSGAVLEARFNRAWKTLALVEELEQAL